MKLYLIEHNEQKQSYSVLVDEDDRLYTITRVEDGTLYVRKAWFENNELISKDWTTSYETSEDYLEKLETLNTIDKLYL